MTNQLDLDFIEKKRFLTRVPLASDFNIRSLAALMQKKISNGSIVEKQITKDLLSGELFLSNKGKQRTFTGYTQDDIGNNPSLDELINYIKEVEKNIIEYHEITSNSQTKNNTSFLATEFHTNDFNNQLLSKRIKEDSFNTSNNKRYVILEGGEASGKSTLIRKIKASLKQTGLSEDNTVFVQEPSGDTRKLVMSHPEWDAWQKAYTIAQGRASLYQQTILPALRSGKTVISDRGFLSALAYQGVAEGLGIEKLIEINERAGFVYDWRNVNVLFLDLNPEIGIARTKNTDRKDTNYMDDLGLTYFKKVQSAFRAFSKAGLATRIQIDADSTPTQTFDKTKKILETIGLDLDSKSFLRKEKEH